MHTIFHQSVIAKLIKFSIRLPYVTTPQTFLPPRHPINIYLDPPMHLLMRTFFSTVYSKVVYNALTLTTLHFHN